MAEKLPLLSDQVRQSLDAAGVSRYAIAKQIGCSQALLSRFMSRTGGLSLDVLDRVSEVLGLRVVSAVRPDHPEKPRRRPAKPQ